MGFVSFDFSMFLIFLGRVIFHLLAHFILCVNGSELFRLAVLGYSQDFEGANFVLAFKQESLPDIGLTSVFV